MLYNNFTERVKVAKRLTNQISFLTSRDRLPVRENMNLLFSCDIVNFLLNTNGGETEGLILLFYVVWSTLIVGGWVLVGVLVAWSRKSCLGPAEITPFVFLVLLKDGGRRVSLRFHLFDSDVNQGNEEAGWIQDFLG